MIPAIIAALSSIIGTVANVNSVRKNNQLQMELADKTNAASVAQAERAYQRSQASNQVGLMQQAGMSKAGAINAINGGGSYQPAPVQTASTQAPQVDLSHAFDGLIQVGENAKQRKAEEKLQREQIDASKEAQQLQIQSEEKKHAASLQTQKEIAQLQADTTNRNADNRLQFDERVYADAEPMRDAELKILQQNFKNLQVEETNKRLNNDLLEIQKELEKGTLNYRILRERAESLTIAANGELERLRSSKMRTAILSMNPDELNAYMHYKARTELSVLLGDAIRDEQWSKNLNENKLKLLQFVEMFVGTRK